ncbi:MAG TPA: oligopeptide/dipeptide ABC transporter ATP-binding protein [Acidimicrobiia bacterium]|nr:oligopeptide/dipeptide ABC transporter ATP-binding protein [Acidimicrobiia bacterium]
MTLLEVTDVTKGFEVRTRRFTRAKGTLTAVKSVSLQIEAGETLGLVGESGCGKSTLGRMVVRLLEPTSGEVRLSGVLYDSDDPVLRRSVQIIFQDPYTSLPPKMTVGRILAEPLLIHRIVPEGQIESRVRQLLSDVGLKPEHANSYGSELSGGQRQRVSIARALAVEPELIVADEAVSALDVSVQAQILNLMRDLQEQRGIAYLFISHDLGVVRYMSHRIAVMYLGEIVELGTADDVSENSLHPYTNALLSAVPSIHGHVSGSRVESEPPDPANPPSGCSFHPRCSWAQDVCAVDSPQLIEWRPGQRAACHFALEVFESSRERRHDQATRGEN